MVETMVLHHSMYLICQCTFCMVSLMDQEAKLSNTVHTSCIKQAGNLTVTSFHKDKTIQSEWAETFCLKPRFLIQFYLFPPYVPEL